MNEKMGEWRDLASAPTETPVIVQYRPWNYAGSTVLAEQVAWLFGGKWRTYPQTNGEAYADRWRPIPSTQPTAEAVREACAKVAEEYPSPLNDLPMALAIRSIASAIRSMPLTEVKS